MSQIPYLYQMRYDTIEIVRYFCSFDSIEIPFMIRKGAVHHEN